MPVRYRDPAERQPRDLLEPVEAREPSARHVPDRFVVRVRPRIGEEIRTLRDARFVIGRQLTEEVTDAPLARAFGRQVCEQMSRNHSGWVYGCTRSSIL